MVVSAAGAGGLTFYFSNTYAENLFLD